MAHNTHKLSFMKETMMAKTLSFHKKTLHDDTGERTGARLLEGGGKDELEMDQRLGKSREAGDHLQLQRKVRFHEDVANHGGLGIFSTPHSTSDKKKKK